MDFASGTYEVTFTAGTTEASFNVSLTDDNIFERNEKFMITVDPSSLPNNVTVGDPDQVIVTIVDNDGKYFILKYSYTYALKLLMSVPSLYNL